MMTMTTSYSTASAMRRSVNVVVVSVVGIVLAMTMILSSSSTTITTVEAAAAVASEKDDIVGTAFEAADLHLHLRTPSSENKKKKLLSSASASASASSSSSTSPAWPLPKKMSGKVEKGMSCSGEIDTKKMTAGRTCKAGMKKTVKAEFSNSDSDSSSSSNAENIADTVVPSMVKSMMTDIVVDNNNGNSDVDEYYKPLDVTEQQLRDMDTLIEMEIDGTVQVEDGFSHTVEFGGVVKAYWGCNVTMTKKDGAYSRTVMCGVKGSEMVGVKPPKELNEDEDDDAHDDDHHYHHDDHETEEQE